MSILQVLRSIDRKLDRIDTNLQAILRSQIVPTPCCRELTLPDGSPLPMLPPQETVPVPGQNTCGQVLRMLRLYVDTWNRFVYYFIEDRAAPLSILFTLITLESGIPPYFTLLFSYALLESIYIALNNIADETLLIDADAIDFCRAARQYISSGGQLPAEIADRLPVAAAIPFASFYTLTLRGTWYDRVDDADFIDTNCCVPDIVQLLPSVVAFSCPFFSGELDVIDQVQPAAVSYIYSRQGSLSYLRRNAVSGLYLQQVNQAGRFDLWYHMFDTAVPENPCDAIAAPYGGFGTGASYLVRATGPQFILVRNRVSYEGVYLEMTREPLYQNIEEI